jgi:hypothetical protein
MQASYAGRRSVIAEPIEILVNKHNHCSVMLQRYIKASASQ